MHEFEDNQEGGLLDYDLEQTKVEEAKQNKSVKEGKFFRTTYSERSVQVEDQLSNRLSHFPIRSFLPIKLLKPPSGIYRSRASKNKVLDVARRIKNEGIILNIGSGTTDLGSNFINMDVFPFPNVNVLGNAHELPFKNYSIEAVAIIGVIEHLRNPQMIVKEIRRVLKRDGFVYAEIPFIQGFHPDPYDWKRYTIQGIGELFHEFHKIDVGVCVGPASGFVWVLREFLAILFSFNNYYLYKLSRWLFTWLTHPISFLDHFLQKNKFSHNIASSLFFLGKNSE
ncbi:MAG: class I SAM-dependent methyltransferase [Bacteroidetes bacterium]|nr:class I SAM-dependent methyltransferase [Bacteroidota bacterium]